MAVHSKHIYAVSGTECVFTEGEFNNIVCCDCGLSHFVWIRRIGRNKIGITMYRDDYQTNLERKPKKRKP